MGKVMCLTHLYSNEVHFLMKGISWGFLLLCHQILDERVIRILLSCNFEMKKWRNIFCSIVWNFTFSISWLLRHCVDWLIKEIFFCLCPSFEITHSPLNFNAKCNWSSIYNQMENQVFIQFICGKIWESMTWEQRKYLSVRHMSQFSCTSPSSVPNSPPTLFGAHSITKLS